MCHIEKRDGGVSSDNDTFEESWMYFTVWIQTHTPGQNKLKDSHMVISGLCKSSSAPSIPQPIIPQ